MKEDIKIGNIVVPTENLWIANHKLLVTGTECIVIGIDPDTGYSIIHITSGDKHHDCGWNFDKVAYANFYGYSDIDPFEIVRFVTPKCIEIRAMRATEEKWDPIWVPDGFGVICINQHNQKWKIESDPNAPTIRIRRHCGKKKGGWFSANGLRFILSNKPHKLYDYNF